ncbi:hypothetical protein BZA77DRAFT_391456, partial [Pyronema omphalodes]
MTTDERRVTDIALVGHWDARNELEPADVMIYAKVTPQSSSKVPLLHLQPLVLESTLVRVVPLLPDGTSPWESPGVKKLNIATISGRRSSRRSSRAHTPGLSSLKKVKHILLDGTGGTSDEGSADSCTPSPSVTSSSEKRKDYVQYPGPITDEALDSKSRSVPNINFNQSPLTDECDPSYAWFSSETSAVSEDPTDEKQKTALRNSELSEPSNTIDTNLCHDESKAHEESPDKVDADLLIFADYDSIQSYIEEGERGEENEDCGSQRNESLSFEAPRMLPESPLLDSSVITKPPFKPDAEILSGVSSSCTVLEQDDDELTRGKKSISTISFESFSSELQNSHDRQPGSSVDSIKLTPVTDSAVRRPSSPIMPLGNDGVEDNRDKESRLKSPRISAINSPQLPMIQGLGITQLDSPRHVSYARSNCGNPDGKAIDVYDWDRIIYSGTEMKNRSSSRLKSCSVIPYPTVRDGRIYSS